MNPINFELKTPFKYAGPSGTEIECSHIELREPTGRVSHICADIEGMVKSAIMDMAERLGDDVLEQAKDAAGEKTPASGSEDQEKTVEDGEAMLTVMHSSGVDMGKLTLHFKELFRQVAWMGGEKQITLPRLDDMAHKDLRSMIGVYTANFILG